MRATSALLTALFASVGLWHCAGVSGSCAVAPSATTANGVTYCVEYGNATSDEQMADQMSCTSNLGGTWATGACARSSDPATAVLGRCYNSDTYLTPRGDGGVASSAQRAFTLVYATGGVTADRAQTFCRSALQGFWVVSSD